MVFDRHLCLQMGNEASSKKIVACISPKSCMQERCKAHFAGQRGRNVDHKSFNKFNTISFCSSRLRVLGMRSGLDAQPLTLQESLRLAVLAEVEVRLMPPTILFHVPRCFA